MRHYDITFTFIRHWSDRGGLVSDSLQVFVAGVVGATMKLFAGISNVHANNIHEDHQVNENKRYV